jgi:hypothetical protein
MLFGLRGLRITTPEMKRPTSNQALERTATRRAFTFQMIKTVLVQATLALGGGRSAFSR